MDGDARTGSGGVAHRPEVPFEDTVVVGEAIDVAEWDWWSVVDGGVTHYYVKGPCPGCRATVQGHAADVPKPVEAQGRRDQEQPVDGTEGRSDTIDVPVSCTCGDDHGHSGAVGCGRRWALTGPRRPA
jgi:hypothetical protein